MINNSMFSHIFYIHDGYVEKSFCAARQNLNQNLALICVFVLAASQHKRYL